MNCFVVIFIPFQPTVFWTGLGNCNFLKLRDGTINQQNTINLSYTEIQIIFPTKYIVEQGSQGLSTVLYMLVMHNVRIGIFCDNLFIY